MEFERPDFSFENLDLLPDEVELTRQTKDLKKIPDKLSGWLSVGEIIVKKMDHSIPEIKSYMKMHKDLKFCSLHFACDFKPPKSGVFEDAWLEIQLNAEEGECIAWSMNPMSEGTETKTSKTYKISSDIKIVPVGINGSMESKREFVQTKPHIEAHKLLTRTPCWEFIHRDARPISGIYMLDLIVKLPKTAKSKVSAKLSTNISDTKFGFFKFTTPFNQDVKKEIWI